MTVTAAFCRVDSAGLFKAGLLNNRQGLVRNLNSDMKA